jgi:hypothetical protein
LPQVPYIKEPTVDPQSPGEQVNVNAPPAAFGENIGAALSHLGTTTDQVGNELFTRAIALQDLANETQARNKVIDFTTQAAQRQADFDSLQGVDAKNALPAHLKAISDMRNDMRGTLSSPMAQKYFDQEASSFQNRITFSSAAHAGEQFKQYAIGTAQARIDNTTKAYVDPFSESEYAAKNQTIENESHTIAGLKGWGEDERQAYVLKQQSVNRLGQIEQQAIENPIKAYDTLQTSIKNGEIDQASGDRALDNIYLHNRGVGVQNQASSIFGPNKSLTDMDAQAHKIAQDPSVTLGDPMFEKDLRTAIRSKALYDKSITTDQNRTNMGTLFDAIHSDKYKTTQELLADPEVGAAIHALPSKDQDKIPEMLKQHWTQHDADAGYANYQALYGSARSNPGQFMDTDLYDPDLHLTKEQRGDLLGIRKQLVANPNVNPQMSRALRWMTVTHGQELDDLGVRHPPARNEDPSSDRVKNYNMYVGSLAQAIEAFQETNKHFPNPQEFEEKVAKPLLMQHSTSEGTWFHGLMGNRDVPEFEKTIPDEVMTEAKSALQEEAAKHDNLGPDYQPSENEVRMYIVRKQWDEFYKKAKASEGGRTGPK